MDAADFIEGSKATEYGAKQEIAFETKYYYARYALALKIKSPAYECIIPKYDR